MENNEEIKKYVITIDGVDFSGKTTLWKNTIQQDNIQIRGILSNIAYGIKYNRDIDKMIEEYNKLPLNYIIYFLNPGRDNILRNFNSRLKERIYDNDFLIKEAKSFIDTITDGKYFEKAYEILKEKYKGEIILRRADDNDEEKFYHYLECNPLKIYSSQELSDAITGSYYDSFIMLHTTIDKFEAQAKKESEFTKIVFIDRLSKEDIIANLIDGLDDEHQGMVTFLINYTSKSYDDIYDDFTNSYDEQTVANFTDFLDTYEVTIEAQVACDIRATVDIPVSLYELRNYDDIEEYVYDRESTTIQNELEYELNNTEYTVEDIEVI